MSRRVCVRKSVWVAALAAMSMGVASPGCSGDDGADEEADGPDAAAPDEQKEPSWLFNKVNDLIKSSSVKNAINSAIKSNVPTTFNIDIGFGTLPWYISTSGRQYSAWLTSIADLNSIEVESLQLGSYSSSSDLWPVQFSTKVAKPTMNFRVWVDGKGEATASATLRLQLSAEMVLKLGWNGAWPCAKVDSADLKFFNVAVSSVKIASGDKIASNILSYIATEAISKVDLDATLDGLQPKISSAAKNAVNSAIGTWVCP